MRPRLELNPGLHKLRQFGWAALLVFGVLGGSALWRGQLLGVQLGKWAIPLALACWLLGALTALLGVVAPKANRPLFVALSLLTFPVSLIVSFVLTIAIYYLFLAPFGFLLRLARPDPMGRAFDPNRESYWEELPPRSDAEQYFKQY